MKYALPILLVILVVTNLMSIFDSDGISQEEHDLKVKLHDLEQENSILETKNNHYETQIKTFEDEILKSDSIIDNSTSEQLDSLFTDYFSR